ncbi:MAG TPA: flagellar hook-length control protein FliK [Caldimonas sp.]|nr:flagellar hook-length control protein FliK [Caldimonas sp.]HEX4234531.1 flagellar hook-length control protein FliK [Caldimonas sp.]
MNAAAIRTAAAAAPAPANVVATLTAVATPTAPDRPSAPDSHAPRRFAELLQEQNSERATPPPAPAAASTATAPSATGDPSNAADGEPAVAKLATISPTPPRSRAPTAKSATGKARTDDLPTPETDSKSRAAVKGDEATSAAPTTTDDCAAALALLAAANAANRGADSGATPAAANAGQGAATANVDATATIATRDDAHRGAVHARGEAVIGAAIGRNAPVEATATAVAAFADKALQAAPGELGSTLRASATTATTIDGSTAAAATIAAGAAIDANGTASVAAAPTSLALATPVDAPEFAATLGVQVSQLAKDGVQHAELHLNPAETGPVSIHIAVEGTAARIDFGADLAATRHAIERGLPELASALRDAGLTLAGGGVSQHAGSRERGGNDPAAGGRASSRRGGEAVVTVATARIGGRTAAGGVDLYA